MSVVRVGVILPLKEKSPRGEKMVEFYQGILMAVDSLRYQGTDVEVRAWHSGVTATDMDMLLSQNSLADCDVVFGPLDVAQVPLLADYCGIHGVRLVVPFSSVTTWVGTTPGYYMLTAPTRTVQSEALWYVQNHFVQHQVVLVQCDDATEDGTAFAEMLRMSMTEKGRACKLLNLHADNAAMEAAFSATTPNVVVLSSSSLKALNSFLPQLKLFAAEHPEHRFCLLGYPDWQTYTSQLLGDFYQVDTYIFTPFYANPLSPRVQAVENAYLRWFHKPMTSVCPKYALMGLDVGWFFLQALARYGDQMDDFVEYLRVEPYQTPLFMQRQGEDGGYVNTFVELVHYTPEQTIELITRNR